MLTKVPTKGESWQAKIMKIACSLQLAYYLIFSENLESAQSKKEIAKMAECDSKLKILAWGTFAPNIFISVTVKEHYFQTDKNIALVHLKRKKKTSRQK